MASDVADLDEADEDETIVSDDSDDEVNDIQDNGSVQALAPVVTRRAKRVPTPKVKAKAKAKGRVQTGRVKADKTLVDSVPPSKPRLARGAKPSKTDVKARQASAQRAANALKQVSDPTRLFILLTLAEGDMHVGAICDLIVMTQPAVSHHLSLMRHGRLIQPRRDSKNVFYSLTDEGRALADVVHPFVEGVIR
jgi:ArsR family transcriptional regulator, zinc-responsive transcriptional repressor